MSNINATVAFDSSQDTISNTAKSLTDLAGFVAADVDAAARLVMVARSKDVNVRWDGTAPTTAAGFIVGEGVTFVLDGNENLQNFQVIRNDTDDATVFITLET